MNAHAYCDRKVLIEKAFDESATGFVVTKAFLKDTQFDITGYIGYLPSDTSIYIIFRGSVSADNYDAVYMDDLVEYTKWPACNCRVHKGF